MPAERAQLARTKRPERFVAMRFAAKEAIVKAMGTGFAHGVWIRDIGVVQNAVGQAGSRLLRAGRSRCDAESRRRRWPRDAHGRGGADRRGRRADARRRTAADVAHPDGAVVREGRVVNYLVFDIETVPDVDLGRRLFNLGGLSDEEVMKACSRCAGRAPGGSELPAS